MAKFHNIEELCAELNSKAIKESFFAQSPEDIDRQANEFVARFSEEYNLKSHTITPSRWWFESEDKMFSEGEIELRPMVYHAMEKLHNSDKDTTIEFVAVNVKDAKLTNN